MAYDTACTAPFRGLVSNPALDLLHQRMQGLVDRRGNAQALSLADDIAVEVVDLGGAATRNILVIDSP